MLSFRRLARGVRALTRGDSVAREMEEEMRYHLEMEAAELMSSGVAPAQAKRQAAIRFGGVQQTKEVAIRGMAFRWLHDLAADARYAWRNIRRAPLTAATIVVTAALGIASVSTVYSLVNTIWVRQYPYPDSRRLVTPVFLSPEGYAGTEVPVELIRAMRSSGNAWERIGAFHEDMKLIAPLTGGSGSMFFLSEVDQPLLDIIGARPALGRLFTADEMKTRAPVVVVSDSIWTSMLARRDLVTRPELRVGGVTRVVIGVMPPGFRFPRWSEVWIPLPDSGQRAIASMVGKGKSSFDRPTFQALVKLRSGVSRDSADGEMRSLADRLTRTDSLFLAGWKARPFDEMFPRLTGAMFGLAALFFIGTLIVLIVACANIANILLARSVIRRGEFAMRAALGASRTRLVRQILGEQLILGVTAGVLAVPLTALGVRMVMRSAPMPPMGLPSYLQFGIDWRVVTFACVISLIAILLFGMTPAREGARVDPLSTIKSAGNAVGSTASSAREGRRLVVIQLALSLLLLNVSAVSLRAFRSMSGVDPGYPAERIVQVPMYLDAKRYPDDTLRSAFAQRLRERLSTDPSVESVATSGYFGGVGGSDSAVGKPRIGDRMFDPANPTLVVERAMYGRSDIAMKTVSPNFFATRGSRQLAGRLFDSRDTVGNTLAAIVTETVARQFWPSNAAVGRQLQIGKSGVPFTVIGVVNSPLQVRLGPNAQGIEARSEVFFTDRQTKGMGLELLVLARTSDDSAHVAKDAVQVAAQSLERDAQFTSLRTIAEEDALQLMPLRMLASILGTLGAISLGLSVLGIYGLTSFVVAQRTREIGIRIALGASARRVVQLVLVGASRLIVTGLGIGCIVSASIVLLVPAVRTRFGMVDVLTIAATVVMLAFVAIVACVAPAWRATRLTPADAMRVT